MSGQDSSDDDATHVAAVRRGDREAFSALVRRYQRPAYLAALAVLESHEEAEDAAQEAFVVALERLDDCREPARFAGWFLTIVRNRARNLDRREQLRGSEPLPVGLASGEPTPEDWIERVELRERLGQAMHGLSEGGVDHETFMIAFEEGRQ